MNCQELLEQLSEYLDEDARAELCREIEEHMEKCHNCRVEVDTIKKTIILYQADRQAETPGLVAASEQLHSILSQEYRTSGEAPVV